MLDAKSLARMMCTCNFMYYVVQNYELKWKQLSRIDFDVYLNNKGRFSSHYEIYKLVYCSRILLGSFTYARYFENMKSRQVPSWLLLWGALSREAPRMKYGLHRIKRRVRGHYLKRLSDVSYGQLQKTFDVSSIDLMNLYPSRVQRGTVYFSYQTVRYTCIRKHGGMEDYINFILNKCYRSRGYVLRNYDKVKNTNPLIPL